MDSYLVAFGACVRQWRLEKGLTQEELAHRAGIHVTYVSGIERGHRNASLINIRRIADALGVEPKDLLSFDVPH